MNTLSYNKKLEEAIVHRESHSLSYLEGVMEENPKIKKMLTTPIYRLGSNELNMSYDFLVGSQLSAYPLYTILQLMIQSGMDITVLYSDYNGTPNGIIIYRESSPDIVEEITVISFDLHKNNIVLIKDLMDTFVSLIKTHKEVKWMCFKKNPAIKSYYKLCSKFGGTFKDSPITDEVVEFSVKRD